MGPSGTVDGLFYAFGFCGRGFQLGDGTAVAVKSVETAPGDQKTLIVTPEKPLAAGCWKVQNARCGASGVRVKQV
jgi:hypothetical protein